jgi:hypothetical protein
MSSERSDACKMAAMNVHDIRTDEELSEAFDINVGSIQLFPFVGWVVLVGDTNEKGSPLRHWALCFVLARTPFNIIWLAKIPFDFVWESLRSGGV